LGSNYKTTHLLNKYLTNEEYSQVVIMNLGVHILGIFLRFLILTICWFECAIQGKAITQIMNRLFRRRSME
jgi:hypothetical protein